MPLRIEARERRTIAVGSAVSVVALVVVFAVVPFVRRWRTREEMIASQTDRLARLHGLAAAEDGLREAVAARTAALDGGARRMVSGRTPALAAAALQSTLQGYADESQLSVSRLDVAGAPLTGDGTLPRLPATMAAVGDLYGVVDLLDRIEHGPIALQFEELTVTPNPALRGELLQVTLALRGAYVGS